MRNWPKTLAPASYRGVPFYVEKEEVGRFGRRIVVHEYTKAEEHGTEDMGRLPQEFRLTAYLASDTADAAARALIDACSARGAATLVLPLFGGTQVRCQAGRAAHERDKLGYVAFELEFVEAGGDGAGFPAIPLGDRIAASALDDLAGMVEDALADFPLPLP